MNHFKCIIQWHFIHSQCCIITASNQFQNISITPRPSFPQPLATNNLFFVPVDLPVLDISEKWNHTFSLLHLASFTQHDVFEDHPHYIISAAFLFIAK